MLRAYSPGTVAVALFIVLALNGCRPAQQPEPPSEPLEPQSQVEPSTE